MWPGEQLHLADHRRLQSERRKDPLLVQRLDLGEDLSADLLLGAPADDHGPDVLDVNSDDRPAAR